MNNNSSLIVGTKRYTNVRTNYLYTTDESSEIILNWNISRHALVSSFTYSRSAATDLAVTIFSKEKIVKSKRWGEIDVNLWSSTEEQWNPSISRYINGWVFVNSWLGSLRASHQALVSIMNYLKEWTDRYSNIPVGAPLFKYIYHDEATAQRLLVAIRLHHIISESKNSESWRNYLVSVINSTARRLSEEWFYSGNNNHGMFQSIALRNFAVYAEWLGLEERDRLFRTACLRLETYFSTSFTSEGVHVEHSPTYHLMIVRKMNEHISFLRSGGLPVPEVLNNTLSESLLHTLHSIRPDRRFLPLSDSEPNVITPASVSFYGSPNLEYLLSQGLYGNEPADDTLFEPKSGYFFHRTAWSNEKSTYLAFIAAYNGNYHKHSDDLHVYLWKNGVELLSEAGPYGYKMKDPFVKYGFSQFGHNSIIINDTSLPRTDDLFHKVRMVSYDKSDKNISVVANNSRHAEVSHTRRVNFDPHVRDISVTDNLESRKIQKYTLIWNLGPGLDAFQDGHRVFGLLGGMEILRFTFKASVPFDISIVKGVSGRKPMGWRFPNFSQKVPVNQIQITFSGSTEVVTTGIEVGDFPNIDPLSIDGDQRLSEMKVNSLDRLSASDSDSCSIGSRMSLLISTLVDVQKQSSNILISSKIRGFRAVIRLYKGSTCIDEKRGLADKIVWKGLAAGKYRVRIYPKGRYAHSNAYSSQWVNIL